jgi:hypothetical protein
MISPGVAPGGLYVVRTPIDQNALLENGRIEFHTQLNVPGNVNDAVPANNVKSSSVSRRPSSEAPVSGLCGIRANITPVGRKWIR